MHFLHFSPSPVSHLLSQNLIILFSLIGKKEESQLIQILFNFVPSHSAQFSIEHFWQFCFDSSSSGIKYPESHFKHSFVVSFLCLHISVISLQDLIYPFSLTSLKEILQEKHSFESFVPLHSPQFSIVHLIHCLFVLSSSG